MVVGLIGQIVVLVVVVVFVTDLVLIQLQAVEVLTVVALRLKPVILILVHNQLMVVGQIGLLVQPIAG